MDPATKLSETAARVLAFAARLKSEDLRKNLVQFEIDGLMYTSTKLPARVGLELFPRVSALLGAGLLRLVVTQEVEELGADRIMAALVLVSERAMRDGLVPLVLDLLRETQCGTLRDEMDKEGRPKGGPVVPSFDTHFRGEYGHLLAVCAFVLAHNYKGPTLGAH